jgi:hypothetical protein
MQRCFRDCSVSFFSPERAGARCAACSCSDWSWRWQRRRSGWDRAVAATIAAPQQRERQSGATRLRSTQQPAVPLRLATAISSRWLSRSSYLFQYMHSSWRGALFSSISRGCRASLLRTHSPPVPRARVAQGRVTRTAVSTLANSSCFLSSQLCFWIPVLGRCMLDGRIDLAPNEHGQSCSIKPQHQYNHGSERSMACGIGVEIVQIDETSATLCDWRLRERRVIPSSRTTKSSTSTA